MRGDFKTPKINVGVLNMAEENICSVKRRGGADVETYEDRMFEGKTRLIPALPKISLLSLR